MAVPPVIIYWFSWMFHEKNHPGICVPPWLWKVPEYSQALLTVRRELLCRSQDAKEDQVGLQCSLKIGRSEVPICEWLKLRARTKYGMIHSQNDQSICALRVALQFRPKPLEHVMSNSRYSNNAGSMLVLPKMDGHGCSIQKKMANNGRFQFGILSPGQYYTHGGS